MLEPDKTIRGLMPFGAAIFLILLILTNKERPNRGLMGIGALILFLGVVLIAAIAAMVLITSGGELQQKALITSAETKEGISPSIEAVSLRGADPTSGGTPHQITRLYLLGRLPAGGEAVSFNNTVLRLDTLFGSQALIYSGVVANGVTATGTQAYVVTYIKNGPYQEDGYLNRGDMVNLKFNIDGNLGETMKGRVSIIPSKGNLYQVEFVTPETMQEPMIILWPIN